MKIIEPSFSLSTPFRDRLTRDDGIQMLRFIERQGRISHRSEDRQTEDSWEKFIKTVVLSHGDWSIAEHVSVTATIRTDRGITHELVRHRLFSFTQESTRFVRNAGEMEFIYPTTMTNIIDPDIKKAAWEIGVNKAEWLYHELLNGGVRPQEARSVLPNALASTIAVTGNLRNWRAFFMQRITKEAHPDMKRITIPMLFEFQKVIPILFDDLVPEEKQSISMRKAR